MEIRKFTINTNTITGNTVALNVLLENKTVGIDFYSDLSEDITMSAQTISVNITGYTDSKLSAVRSYSFNNPYIVGVNGVTQVTVSSIFYNINDINYVTNLSDLTTTFQFSTVRNFYVNHNYIAEENLMNYVDETQIDNEILIERQIISVIENFSKLRQISTVEDFSTFSNSFYNVDDQSVQ